METALPSATLVVETAQWRENVKGFDLQGRPPAPATLIAGVDRLSTNAHLELKALIGEQMSLLLMYANGSYRTWHGKAGRRAALAAAR